SLCATIFRIDPITGELRTASAGLGPLLHRTHDGHVLSLAAGAGALGAPGGGPIEETEIGWGPGDLCLLATPAPSDLPIAPWLKEGPGATVNAALDRAAAELPESVAFVALRRG
ncbi:MAG: SpoIIE family protein phosphatase, partial [Planctomycetota bacterium]